LAGHALHTHSRRAATPDAPPAPAGTAPGRGLRDIVIHGAREHNLQNLTLRLPRQSLIVVTGVSGSGKSSLAFDTLYAEGQRRYVESLSAYARQFLGQMEKPDVDSIEGLSPAIAIEQRGAGSNPRSTVATVTEIYDYLRLLFSRVGIQYCPNCGTRMERQSVQEIVDALLERVPGARVALLAPLVRGRKGEYRKELDTAHRQGYLRARIDGEWVELESPPKLARYKRHDIDIVVDRLVVRDDARSRLAESVETALKLGNGLLTVAQDGADDLPFSQGAACPNCGASVEELQPRSFSFNSPYGACKSCDGLGTRLEVDPARVVPDPALSIAEGAIAAWGDAEGTWIGGTLKALARKFSFALDVPWKKLPARTRDLLLYGSGDEKVKFEYRTQKGSAFIHTSKYEGVIRASNAASAARRATRCAGRSRR
jgi:excinuclease ABC subunit A